MPNISPREIQHRVENILKVWSANPDFKLKDISLGSFKSDADRFREILTAIGGKEAELKPLRNDRDELTLKLNSVCARARAGIRGYFGQNSSEYEFVGGTRTFERKKPASRKPQTNEAK